MSETLGDKTEYIRPKAKEGYYFRSIDLKISQGIYGPNQRQ